ncbi:MAG: hypothetical protein AAFX85_04990 [Pseudomonadota bacterium]
MAELFVEMLAQARNSLGRTEEAVELVLAQPERIEELYQCYFQPNEWVRLRASSAFKRIWRRQVTLFLPYLTRFVDDISLIDQPSVRWTFAQLCLDLDAHLSASQRVTCVQRLQGYLQSTDDWIVQNTTVETLGTWARRDESLRRWLCPRLTVLVAQGRKSVAKRAAGWLERLGD